MTKHAKKTEPLQLVERKTANVNVPKAICVLIV